jgi:CheY-like chemotaxis protein
LIQISECQILNTDCNKGNVENYIKTRIEKLKDPKMLLIGTKSHYSYPILDNGISSFRYLSESSASLTNQNCPQNQRSNLHTIVKTEAKVSLKPPFIKRILLVDDDPDITLTFKAGLEGHYYGDGDKRRFEVYTYNDPLLALKEFKPHFYDVLLTDVYMPNMSGFELFEKVVQLDVNIRVCFMTAFVVNIRALRDVYSNVNLGCFIEKPVSIKYLIDRLSAELD